MKRSGWLLALAFLLIPVLGAQEAQKSGGEQEQKPTLGPSPAPALRGPRTATVNDYRSSREFAASTSRGWTTP